MRKIKSVLLLLCAAFLWGVAFVAQDVGTEYIEPFTFTSIRCFMGAAVLAVIAFIIDRCKKKKMPTEETPEEKKAHRKNLIIGGLICGVVMCCATNLQQIGLVYTTAGKSGFITACYIVLVPVIGLFFKRKCPFTVWISVAAAVVGLYLLCMGKGFDGINKGDVITIFAAISFAMHILAVDHFVVKTDAVKLACAQCLVNAVISGICMLIFESPQIDKILQAYIPLIYTGVFSAGIAYMFQIVGQKGLNPTLASLTMSVESVISVIAAWIILHQTLSAKEIIGCVIIFAAVILAQIPIKKASSRCLVKY